VGEPLRVRLGGYAPAGSTHGQALDRIAAELYAGLDDQVTVDIDYNILDSGRAAQALLEDVEAGVTTLCFFSSSYLVDRVPELGIIDLPYLFDSLEHAHAALDGALGAALSERTRHRTGLLPLGYWDNGFRHISNRSRDIRSPEDCRGLRVRLQPNWAHEQFFRALGTEAVCNDLREGIAMLMSGELDAQENPFANFVAYGIDKVHPHVTLTGHVYGARGVYASAQQLREWPDHAQDVLDGAVAAAVQQQRVAAARREAELRDQLATGGTRIITLTDDELSAFRAVAEPMLTQARERLDDALWEMLDGSAR
jgi:TRAP-type C4-dicarboxylate transport system substrate-binding protein